MSEKNGGEFINFKYPDLQKSTQVQKSVEKKQRLEGLKTPNNPANRNEVFLDRLEHIFDNPNSETKNRNIKFFKNQFLYPSVLIDKDNIPDSYFDLQLKIARERGQAGDLGHIQTAKDIPPETKKQTGETLYNDQKQSLDVWIDYLSSADASYPSWFKYYALRNVTKMGSYNKETHEFGKRSKTSTGIFPDLNREALAYSYDTLSKHYLKGEKVEGDELTKILDSAKFDKIYAFAIDKVTPASHENKEKTEGSWTKFDQGSDATPLYESLQGHGTGWCTAGEGVAQSQLQNGDFYVYYTKDEHGHNTIPRIAIRMENGQVAEVRGIGPGQNMEGNMTDIAREKYHQLPGGEKFDKKDHDMKWLTLIDNKVNNNQELSKDELCFLYEINYQIEGFGYGKDPRIEEIRNKRNNVADLNFYFKGMDTIDGDLDLQYLTSAKGLVLPKTINGNLDLHNLTSAEDLVLPYIVYGDFDLSNLTHVKGLDLSNITINRSINLPHLTFAEDLILPKTIKGDLDLSSLTSAKGLTLPETINGNLNLSGLTSAKDLILPESIKGDLNLRHLTSAEGLTLPKTVNYDLDLSHLTSAEGLTLPENINGYYLNLHNLISAKGLTSPNTINYSLDLSNLTSAEDLVLPKTINGNLILYSLTSAEGLVLPKTINGNLNLYHLTSAEDLVLPKTINGNLDLRHLTSAEGLILPETINGDLNLRHLTSAEGLILPKTIKGDLDLYSLTSAKGLTLPETIYGDLILCSLTSAKDLILPKTINGSLNLSDLTSVEGLDFSSITINRGIYLRNLTSAKDLTLPKTINDSLDLRSLTSAEGLVLPDTINGSLNLSSLDYYQKQLLKQQYPRLHII